MGTRVGTGIAVSSLIAIAFMALVYPYTFRAWFQADDLGWLSLGQHVSTWQDWLWAMFAPLAQGTIRPLSERVIYLAGFSLFGLNALPFRITIFALQAANIVMFCVIARRLVRSDAAGLWASLLWISNIALATIMTWTGACSEPVCTLFLLSAFYYLLRYVETGSKKYEVAHWIAYLAAFGALEITVMYPFVAAAYAWLFARSYWRRSFALFVPAVLFTIVHETVRTPPKTHVYDLHFDWSMFTTFAAYTRLALGPAAVLLVVALLAFVFRQYRGGDRITLFGLIWFVAFLGPFLPVRDHITNYYLTIPVLGLSLIGASAIVAIPAGGLAYRCITIACLLFYFGYSIPATRADSKALWARSMPVKRLVLGVQKIHQESPGKVILLDGVSDELFWMAVYDHPFQLFKAEVYLTPPNAAKLTPYPELGNIADYTISNERSLTMLQAGQAVVYTADLRNITHIFKAAALGTEVPLRIEIGHPAIESMLGPTWYPSEGEYRWMPAEATVRLGSPPNGRGIIRVHANCSPLQVRDRALLITLSVNGSALDRPVEIRSCNAPLTFERRFAVTPDHKGIDVALKVDRTIHAGADTRDLGLAVSVIEVVP